MTEWIGFVAAFCTTTAFIPQVVQVWRTRRTDDLSLGMFSLLTVGIALWLVYGILHDSAPVYLANGCTLVLAGYILYMKLTEGSRRS
ncbi:MAG: SemiSWEET transporter [Sandaracinaceae bacterium]|nr:SemiSWEET transporter [Sandaracinaceae bacterium]